MAEKSKKKTGRTITEEEMAQVVREVFPPLFLSDEDCKEVAANALRRYNQRKGKKPSAEPVQ